MRKNKLQRNPESAAHCSIKDADEKIAVIAMKKSDQEEKDDLKIKGNAVEMTVLSHQLLR